MISKPRDHVIRILAQSVYDDRQTYICREKHKLSAISFPRSLQSSIKLVETYVPLVLIRPGWTWKSRLIAIRALCRLPCLTWNRLVIIARRPGLRAGARLFRFKEAFSILINVSFTMWSFSLDLSLISRFYSQFFFAVNSYKYPYTTRILFENVSKESMWIFTLCVQIISGKLVNIIKYISISILSI